MILILRTSKKIIKIKDEKNEHKTDFNVIDLIGSTNQIGYRSIKVTRHL
jgi:hypothetical protein